MSIQGRRPHVGQGILRNPQVEQEQGCGILVIFCQHEKTAAPFLKNFSDLFCIWKTKTQRYEPRSYSSRKSVKEQTYLEVCKKKNKSERFAD